MKCGACATGRASVAALGRSTAPAAVGISACADVVVSSRAPVARIARTGIAMTIPPTTGAPHMRNNLTPIERQLTREALANTPERQKERRLREKAARLSERAGEWERAELEGRR